MSRLTISIVINALIGFLVGSLIAVTTDDLAYTIAFYFIGLIVGAVMVTLSFWAADE
jgi:hypothetical protein